MSTPPPSPLETTTPPPARRFTHMAIGLALAGIVLLVTLTALVITSPAVKPSRQNSSVANDVRPADAAFLNSPPRRREEAVPPSPSPEVAALLREARDRSSDSPSGPFALGAPEPLPAAPPSPASSLPSYEDPPPPGVYRPYAYTPPRPTLAPPAPAPASWQAAFNSSLVPSSASTPPAPAPPAFTPPPSLEALKAPTSPNGPPDTTNAPPTSPIRRTDRLGAVGHRTVAAGTVVDAILLTSISSQHAGDAFAHVSVDVRSPNGSVVIPRGSRLVGSYQNRVALGDRRIAVAWDRILLPGGRTADLPGLPSASPDGAAGLPGSVNNHTALVFGRAALLSLIGAGAQLGQPRRSRIGDALSDREVLSGSVSQQLSAAAAELLNRAVDVTPTLFVPAGSRVTVLVPQDLDLP